MAAVRHRLRAARLLPLLAVGLVLIGCTEPEASPTTTTRRSEPTSSASLPPAPASWAAFGAFVNGAPPGEPGDYFEGDHLIGVLDRIRQYAADGLELRGEADLAPSDVEIVGAAASLVDCQIDRTYAVERSTGEVVIPASGRPQLVVVELVRDGGRWKVSSVDYGAEGSCER
jgi:hypothetical protein